MDRLSLMYQSIEIDQYEFLKDRIHNEFNIILFYNCPNFEDKYCDGIFGYLRIKWAKYKLRICRPIFSLRLMEGKSLEECFVILAECIKNHELVYNWLEEHPDEAKKYNPNQSGELKYFDILTKAESSGGI